VDEQIKAIDVLTRKTVWHAEVMEIGRPVYRADYIFFSTKGKEAPSPAVLMGRNARKFCNMFLTVSEEHESLSEDMRLVNDGDNYLVTKEYEKAKSLFEKALEINPDNGYALFNLGLVHERQGNKEEAIKMYQKVIALNIDATDKESNAPIKMGQSLVVLAKEHIATLEK
jgi:tetratricopeptide (TPR) repeat protein